MNKNIFLLISLIVLSIPSVCQITIIDITEDKAKRLIENFKKNNLSHTHIKQWNDNFVNIAPSREEYLNALDDIHNLIMPYKININRMYNKILKEHSLLCEEVEKLEQNDSLTTSKELELKKKSLEIFRDVEFSKYPYIHFHEYFEKSEDVFGYGLEEYNNEIGDTIYIYTSVFPESNDFQEYDQNYRAAELSNFQKNYYLNTTSVYFGIICNQRVAKTMCSNRIDREIALTKKSKP
jgi:hypothetical protein